MDESNGRMTFWKKLIGSDDPESVDYYREGIELLEGKKFHDALTSFRLALRESPGDPVVLQHIAMCYTHIGLTDDAIKTYKHVLQKDPSAVGAHYGLAFILLRTRREEEAIPHLEAFLANPPPGVQAGAHIEHARTTLARIRTVQHDSGPEPEPLL